MSFKKRREPLDLRESKDYYEILEATKEELLEAIDSVIEEWKKLTPEQKQRVIDDRYISKKYSYLDERFNSDIWYFCNELEKLLEDMNEHSGLLSYFGEDEDLYDLYDELVSNGEEIPEELKDFNRDDI